MRKSRRFVRSHLCKIPNSFVQSKLSLKGIVITNKNMLLLPVTSATASKKPFYQLILLDYPIASLTLELERNFAIFGSTNRALHSTHTNQTTSAHRSTKAEQRKTHSASTNTSPCKSSILPLTHTFLPLTLTNSVLTTTNWFANVGFLYLTSNVAVTPILDGSEKKAWRRRGVAVVA